MYALSQIIDIVEGKVFAQNPSLLDSVQIKHLFLDSRAVFYVDQALFFAIKGNRHDGHEYIDSLYQKGIRAFVVSTLHNYAQEMPDAIFIQVENTLTALQKLTAWHRQHFSIPIIGITGSNGKTIVKEWLFQLLHQDLAIARSPKSYNSQIGVPLSVWQLQPYHQLGIFEAGISQRNEMNQLAPIIRCNIGIFTNIGEAHSEGFSSKEEKILEKIQLFQYANALIYQCDDPIVANCIKTHFKGEHWNWSFLDKNATLFIEKITKIQQNKVTIQGVFEGKNHEITLNFSDEASIQNAIHCWVYLLKKDYAETTIQARFLSLETVEMRLEMKQGINNCVVINDSYNADLNSITIALNFLANQTYLPKKTIILSDILQSDQDDDELYAEIAILIAERNIHQFIGIGERVTCIKSYLLEGIEAHFFPNTEVFLQEIKKIRLENECILVKGARTFQLEKIVHRLEQKAHKTTLEVNLSAIRHNLHTYSKLLTPKTALMVMIKASGYGSGSVEIAKVLEQQNVAYLAVAYADEGIELRKAGITMPIMVLNPEEASFDMLLRFNLEPEMYSLNLLKSYAQFTKNNNNLSSIHLKLDTGMHRLGFEESDLPQLLQLLTEHKQLFVKTLFSHLAASESTQHDDFTNFQADRFSKMSDQILQTLGYTPLRHLVNSAGISRFPQYHFEMVRLGIGLYGIDSDPKIQANLMVVNTLKATVSQVKIIQPNDTIGYGRMGVAQNLTKIATISIGYADGLLRRASNGNFRVHIKNQLAPIIGRVCMDMTMVDVTHIPDINEGDEVEIFGKNAPVTNLAQALETIPYEIFTSISSRVNRVYFWE